MVEESTLLRARWRVVVRPCSFLLSCFVLPEHSQRTAATKHRQECSCEASEGSSHDWFNQQSVSKRVGQGLVGAHGEPFTRRRMNGDLVDHFSSIP